MGGDRDREREGDRKKKKKRSASSESAERSREREKKRRKQQAEHVNKNRAPTAPGPGSVAGADAAAAAGQRMFWDGFQWVPRADTSTNPNDPNVSRKLRRLYLGNLPYDKGITEDAFSKQLFDAMKEKGFCNDPNQNPVLHVWFARDKGANYGFCEIASIEETEKALQLNGIMMMGAAVSISRPNDAQSPMGMIGGMQPGMSVPGGGGMLALPMMQVQATTTIIRIEQILKVDSKTTIDDYDDVMEDMKEGCGSHGKLKNVLIVKPNHVEKKPELQAGDVYLQAGSVDDATKIMRAMGHRKYDGRQIQMKSYEEDKFITIIKPLL